MANTVLHNQYISDLLFLREVVVLISSVLFSLTEVATAMSPTYRANQKDEERNYNVTLVGIMTAIALSFLLLGGTYCLRRKFVCRKEKQKRKLITKFFTVRVILVHPHL